MELSQELPLPQVPLPRIGASFEELFVEPVVTYLQALPKELAPKTLRKLFERLGSTYIKLGQFIASSPTLFHFVSSTARTSAAAPQKEGEKEEHSSREAGGLIVSNLPA